MRKDGKERERDQELIGWEWVRNNVKQSVKGLAKSGKNMAKSNVKESKKVKEWKGTLLAGNNLKRRDRGLEKQTNEKSRIENERAGSFQVKRWIFGEEQGEKNRERAREYWRKQSLKQKENKLRRRDSGRKERGKKIAIWILHELTSRKTVNIIQSSISRRSDSLYFILNDVLGKIAVQKFCSRQQAT